MALRFIESFEHLGGSPYSGPILKKWDASNAANGSAFDPAYGRTNSGLFINGWDNSWIEKWLDAQPTWIVGAAVYFANNSGFDSAIIGFQDGTSAQVEIRRMSSSKFLAISRNGTVIATGTTQIRLGRWYYIEFKATIHNSTGSAEIILNGISEVSISGTDTQFTANATADTIHIGGSGGSFAGNIYLDDIYICDGTGSAPANTFLGDVRVDTLLPNGNGNSSQLLGSDGNSTDNYLLVDEATPNEDTDYVESSTVAQKDTYTYGNLTPTTGTVFGVQILPFARKTDAGTRKIASIARHSGTEVDSADKTLSSTYLYYPDIRETKPGGGSWSISDVNGAEFGVKVTA
jgi:hypothetical protein